MAIVARKRRRTASGAGGLSGVVKWLVVVLAVMVFASGIVFCVRRRAAETQAQVSTPEVHNAAVATSEVSRAALESHYADGGLQETARPTTVVDYAENAVDENADVPVAEEAPEEVPKDKPKRRAGARVVDKDGNDVFKPRPELKTKTDKFLFAILSRPMGAGRVVLTTYKIDDDFKKALEAPIEIMPTDTDDEIAIKQEVEGWKEWLKEQVDSGVPVAELLEDLKSQVNLAAEAHAFARRKLYKMVKEGNMDAALDYLDTINAQFEKEGVLPLHIPEKLFDRGLEKYESASQED